MEIKLSIKKVVVLLTENTDIINIHYNGESSFLSDDYGPVLKMETKHNYGVEYVKKQFNIEAEVINTRINKNKE